MEKNQENQNEYYKSSLNAKIPLAEMVIKEAYNNQINIVKKQQEIVEKMGFIENVSFINIVPRRGERLMRRNGFVIGLKEIYVGEESKQLFEAGIYTEEENKIYDSVEVSEKPFGYTFGFSVKFPEKKYSIVIDSEKGESVPINSENLENKLKEQGLKPSLVKKAQTKYNDEKWDKEQVYQVFFNYAISEKKIDEFRKMKVEEIKDDFRNGIKKPLEKAIDYIVNLELK